MNHDIDVADAAYFLNYQESRIRHWEKVAVRPNPGIAWSRAYHQRIQRIYQQLIPTGSNILELGCGVGDLLAALRPAIGVGIDFSGEMVKKAASKHPELSFLQRDVHEIEALNQKFDYIILSDLVNELWDVQDVFSGIRGLCTDRTRIIINSYSRAWEFPLWLTKILNLASPVINQNWLTNTDLINLLKLSGFEPIRTWQEILLPLNLPLLAPFLNRFLVRLWPINHFALTNFLVARKQPEIEDYREPTPISVIVPARNEAGNIHHVFDNLPDFGTKIELVFVEGGSSDDTYAVIEEQIRGHPEINCQLLKQTSAGKRDAVREGFEHASGEILMILDADLTVPFSYLPRFYRAICSGQGDFINGVRLVYPLEKDSMRYANLLGNKFFSIVFSWILGQPIKDTLCGTKVLRKADYQRISSNRETFGDFDPFGDFDLLLGAGKLNLKIVDIPIRYQPRSYGSTNISRWKHGMYLLKMAVIGMWKMKFQ